MKNLILTIISLAAVSSYSIGQVTVQGIVFAQQPKRPITNAYVQLSDSVSVWNTVTDDQGRFTFNSVNQGSYTIEINHIQFERRTRTIYVDDHSKTVNFELKSEYEFLDASVITGVRASKSAPLTTSNISAKQIQQSDQQKDFPFLLNTTPSTVLSSDAGNGVGYTGIRIRGIDPTRVNITINGIPLNDAESQGVYWVNLPDLASSTESVQIQRGVGSSTNGGASLGASVNIRTNDLDTLKFTQVVLGAGSFATNRLSVQHNSGNLKNNWRYQLRGSIIESDGYIDRATSDLKSFNLILGKYWKKASIKANVLLGSERTYQAWWGVPEPKFFGDIAETNRYIEQLYIGGSDLQNLLNSGSKTYNYYTYENEVDNYNQNHYQLFHDYKISSRWSVNSAAYVTTGKGYFEQYKASENFSDYGLSDYVIAMDTFSTGDVIRRRWLQNTLAGFVTNARYSNNGLELTLGTGGSVYNGRHFGEAIATEFSEYEEYNAKYYDNDAQKTELNSYIKATYRLGKWLPYIDIQQRQVNYSFEGLDNNLEFGDQTVSYTFFNPKVGLTFSNKFYQIYASFGQANREPVRDDFRNNKPGDWPKHEQLDNLEVGYRYQRGRKQFGITVYNMLYTNQLVLTGAVNDVGEAVRTNVESSFRRGVELEAQYPVTKQLQVGGNLTLSENKIESFTEFVSEWDGAFGQISNTYNNTNISFSPEVIGMFMLQYNASKNTQISCHIKHVGHQYLDNTEFAGRKLEAFSTVNFALQHVLKLTEKQSPITIGVYVNNCLNVHYAPNGYTYSGYIQGQRQDFNYLYPMAGRNLMLKAKLRI